MKVIAVLMMVSAFTIATSVLNFSRFNFSWIASGQYAQVDMLVLLAVLEYLGVCPKLHQTRPRLLTGLYIQHHYLVIPFVQVVGSAGEGNLIAEVQVI